MNIIAYAESLQARMKQELDQLSSGEDEIIRIGKILTSIRGMVRELKAYTRKYKFAGQAEEIQFFKETKPIFLSQYFFYKKVFAIRLFDSFKDVKARRSNYYRLLQQLEKYMSKNLDFYRYCMSGEVYLDAHYFTRNSSSQKSLDGDETFSTGFDTKLAKILANELLKKRILSLLNNTAGGPGTTLTWTGQKTELTELVYALHAAEVFNNGSASIKLIASAVEEVFNVKLGDYYRTFLDMRIRKKSPSPFLDQLRDKFVQRVNETD